MKKLGTDLESTKQSYQGHCSSCAEVYVIQVEVDDLEGMIFSCKKIGCGGKISLKVEDEFKISLINKKPAQRAKFH